MAMISRLFNIVEKIPVICAVINTRRTDILRSEEDRLKEEISQTPYNHVFDSSRWDTHVDLHVFELAMDDGQRFHELKSELEKNLGAARDYKSRTKGNWWEPVFGDLEDSLDRLFKRIEATYNKKIDIIRKYTHTRSKCTRDFDELKVLNELVVKSIPEFTDPYELNREQVAQNIRDIVDGEILETKRTLKEEIEFLAKHREYTDDKDPFDHISLSPEDIEKARQSYLKELSNPRSELQKRLSSLQRHSMYDIFDENTKSLLDVVELLVEFRQLPGYELTDDHKKDIICAIYARIKNEIIKSPGDRERVHGVNEFYAQEIIGLVKKADQLNSELGSNGVNNYEEMKKEAVQHACEVYRENLKFNTERSGIKFIRYSPFEETSVAAPTLIGAMSLFYDAFQEFIPYSCDEFLGRDKPKDDPTDNQEAFCV